VLDEAGQRELVRRMLDLLKGFDPKRTPNYYITLAHRILKGMAGDLKPLLDQRSRTNKALIRLMEVIRPRISADYQGFEELLGWVVWANSLDFRSVCRGYRFDLRSIPADLEAKVKTGLAVNEAQRIWEAIGSSRRILYILDNVGEIAFDRLFIERFLADYEVVASVRGGVLTSDATIDDARAAGFDLVARLIESGPDTLGVLWEERSKALDSALDWADLIIAKGQANFYTFSEYPPKRAALIFLFSTKCDPVAQLFGKQGKVGIAKLY
jgi:hypothetical protein